MNAHKKIVEQAERIDALEQELAKAQDAMRRIVALVDSSILRDPTKRQIQRIAELEEQSAAWQAAAKELSESHTQVVAERNALEAQLAAARLLLVAIDENICMSSNPLTITTIETAIGRIVDLIRDPARNPWAGLMRAGKERGSNA